MPTHDRSPIILNINGEITPADRAQVSVFDRGYLYGDSLYEVVRSYNGVFLHLDEHLARMEKSAALCRMVMAHTAESLRKEVLRTFDAFRSKHRGEAYCRIIISRGAGKIGFGLNCLETPTLYTIIIQPVETPPASQYEQGLHLQISERLRNDSRALDPAMKSGNYLNSLLAYLDASSLNYDDALLCNADGHVTEGTTFNVFYVHRGILCTPPLDIGILDGITRRRVLTLAQGLGIEVREVRFPRERLYESDEIFVSSSIKEVMAVTKLDQKLISKGKPGPVTRKLLVKYREEITQLTGARGKS